MNFVSNIIAKIDILTLCVINDDFSGIFFEDSYLPTNLDSLNMEEDTSILQVPCENETNTTTNTATALIDSEESDNLSSKKLQGNGSENLIET